MVHRLCDGKLASVLSYRITFSFLTPSLQLPALSWWQAWICGDIQAHLINKNLFADFII